ncbi:MAG: hypothetical protein IPJ88_16440 [Myxococcales bacterium]|nr:MAG: hypothetical protein IPJ88_16440 [Myxococcales bacterium]
MTNQDPLELMIAALRHKQADPKNAPRTRARILQDLVLKKDEKHIWPVVIAVAALLFASSAWATLHYELEFPFLLLRAPAPQKPHPQGMATRLSSSPKNQPSVAVASANNFNNAERAFSQTSKTGQDLAPPKTHLLAKPNQAIASPPQLDTLKGAERHAYLGAHALHFYKRDYPSALDAWNNYIQDFPNGLLNAEARYNRVIALIKLGKFTRASIELETLEIFPELKYRHRDMQKLRTWLEQHHEPQ